MGEASADTRPAARVVATLGNSASDAARDDSSGRGSDTRLLCQAIHTYASEATFAETAPGRLEEALARWQFLLGSRPRTPPLIWKVPSFAFASREVQLGYFEEATNIVHEASGGKQPKDRIWINVVHAVDGAWSVAGKAMTNDQLKEAAAKG